MSRIRTGSLQCFLIFPVYVFPESQPLAGKRTTVTVFRRTMRRLHRLKACLIMSPNRASSLASYDECQTPQNGQQHGCHVHSADIAGQA